MWRKELLAAIDKQQEVTIRMFDGEILKGTAEACTDRVKLRNDNGVTYIPLADIKHVSRVIKLKRKIDPTSK